MVMHARKTQRINDGYFEKHQTHPYQNSKYNSSKGSYSERYAERIRDSPNGNSYRSESPDPSSPRERDRLYQNKLYMHKIRDKERDNRDYNSSRDKYSDCSRSPKDKRREADRGNHERVEERVQRVGDWSEHFSSSGKKYYYNCKTEVSQWEKPREWLERERRHNKDADPRYLGRIGHEKHSSGRTRERADVKLPPWARDEASDRRRVDGDDMDISPNSTPSSDPERRLAAVAAANAAVAASTAASSATSISTSSAPPSLSIPVATTTVTASPIAPIAATIPPPEDLPPLSLEVPPPGQVVDGGPPTPTHSENHDSSEPRKLGSPVGSVSALSVTPAVSSSLLALRTTAPLLTPSLGNYYREELTNHIRNWPVHAIEKQVLKLAEETHNLTSIHCTRVSAELKTARAVVRLTEIQATLQEQRILFLRQQIKTLEQLNTQHSFMGD